MRSQIIAIRRTEKSTEYVVKFTVPAEYDPGIKAENGKQYLDILVRW